MKFEELLHELEKDYGRLNFRDRLMLRRAYDVVPEKEEQNQIYHKVDKWDSEHRFYAFQNIGEISKNIWHINESENGSYPKCNVIKWFKTREDVEYYLKNNKKSDVKKEPNFTYEDYQNASNDITYSQYPFWRG